MIELQILTSRADSQVSTLQLQYEAPADDQSTSLLNEYHFDNIKLSSVRETTVNALNMLMGIGLLSIPYAISKLGWFLGLGCLIFFSIIACYTASLLGMLMSGSKNDSVPRNLYDVAVTAFGPRFRLFMVLIFCLDLFLVAVANVILFSDSVLSIFPNLGLFKTWLKVGAVALLTPFTWQNSMGRMAWLSSFGVFSLLLLLIIVFFDGLSTSSSPGSLLYPAYTTFDPKSWSEVGLATGILFAGLNAHAAFPSLHSQMKKPQKFGFSMTLTYVIVCLFYGLAGSVGYLMFGEQVMPELSQNLPKIASYNIVLTQIALWAITLNPLTKFALLLHPVNSMTESFLKVRIHPVFTRSMIAFAVLGVAIMFPSFHLMMGLIGSSLSFLIVVVFPVICYLKIEWDRAAWYEISFASVILVFGVFMMIFGTLGVIYTS